MRKLLNTLYIFREDTYLSLDGENVVAKAGGAEVFRVPFCNFENITCFGYMGCSPMLMAKCAERGVALNFVRPSGKFLARVTGPIKGNVLLRQAQFKNLNNEDYCLQLAKNEIKSKIFNSRAFLQRAARDRSDSRTTGVLNRAVCSLLESLHKIDAVDNADSLRGIEGEAAKVYFNAFDKLILKNKEGFFLLERNKRPPLDRVNAMLSYLYTLLALDIGSALETVGLDPYIGFFHTDRPGRPALALDMMEELRCYIVDRFVISLINLEQVRPEGFEVREGGAVIMDDSTRRNIIKLWQERKKEIITHPVINEKIEMGLLPYVQAQLLAKKLRGETEDYIPFLMEK